MKTKFSIFLILLGILAFQVNADIGTHNRVLRFTDPGNVSLEIPITIIVNPANNPPGLINPFGTQQITEDVAFTFQFAANVFNDVDGDPITYSAALQNGSPLPEWLTFDANTRTFIGIPTNDEVGLNTIRITATDDKNASNYYDFNFDVINTNDAPIAVVPSFSVGAAKEDIAYNTVIPQTSYLSDPDVGDVLTYSMTLADDSPLSGNWLTYNPASGGISGTPTQSDVGTHSYKLIATDQNDEFAVSTFDIVVQNTNDPVQVINPVPNQTATGGQAWSFQFADNTFLDPDPGNPTPFYAAVETGQAGLPSWLQFIAVNRTFQTTPIIPASEIGNTYSIDILASDGQSAQVAATFQLNIVANSSPTVENAIPDQQVNEDATFNFQFAANTFTDADGDPLTYNATLFGGGALPDWLTFEGATRTFTGTPDNDDYIALDVMNILVTANDGKGGTAETEFELEILNTNDAPIVVNSIPNQQTDEDALFTFQFAANTFSDPDWNDVVSYSISTTLPDWLSFNATNRTFTGTPENADVGILSVMLTATDQSNASVSTEFSITVNNVNDAPILANAITNQTANEDAVFSFQFAANTFTDEDGDALTYSISPSTALPSWLSFNASNRTFTGTPLVTDIGIRTVTVIATDGNLDASTTFSLEVVSVNDAPILANDIPNQTATEDVLFSYQFASNVFSDEENDPLTYAASLADDSALPQWISFDGPTQTFSGTPGNSDVGTIDVKLIAFDGSGEAFTTFNIEVINTNDAPTVLNPVPDLTASPNQEFLFAFADNAFADEDEGDVLTLTVLQVDDSELPEWLSFDESSKSIFGTPKSDHIGTLNLKIIATDSEETTVSDDFTLTVTPIAGINSFSEQVSIYPNPTSDVIHVNIDHSMLIRSIHVIGMTGKKLLGIKGSNMLDVSGLNGGIYFIQIETQVGTATKRFIKK